MLERLRLDGCVAIVLGAGRSMGREMALALADAGADVVCAARTAAQIEDTAQQVRERGRLALAVPTDASRSADVDALVRRTVEEFGRVDVFVANAGGGGASGGKDLPDITDAEWQESIDLNLSSVFYSARAVVPQFRAQGGGVLLMVSTPTGYRGAARSGSTPYSAAKEGLLGLMHVLAASLARDKIRVNAVMPGYTQTDARQTEEGIRAARAMGPEFAAGRAGEPWELGTLVAFLASAAAAYLTGETFPIDGGALAGGLTPLGWDVTAGPGEWRRG